MARIASEHTENLIAGLNYKFNTVPGAYGSTWHYEFDVEPGVRFDRVVSRSTLNDGDRGFGSIYCYVERATGRVAKANGKSPAFSMAGGKKGDLLSQHDVSTEDGLREAIEASDPHGSWLYQR